jgi:hypothetical protein
LKMPVQLLIQLPVNITFWKEQVWLKWTRRPLKITATCFLLDRTICFSMLLRGKQWASLCFWSFLSGVLADTRKPNLSYLQLMHKHCKATNRWPLILQTWSSQPATSSAPMSSISIQPLAPPNLHFLDLLP